MRTLLLFMVLLCSCTYPAPDRPGTSLSEVLHVCWSSDGSYAPAGVDCGTPLPVRWSALPLLVTSDHFTASYTAASVEVWNQWLGFRAFKYSALTINADVRVRYVGKPPDKQPNLAGMVILKRNKLNQEALVAIFEKGMLDDTVFAHEFGHVLGLAHDPDNRQSVMFPSAPQAFMPALEDQDRRLIREKYLHRR